MRKAVEEVRLARDVVKTAEEQRVAALKAAEEATKAAAATIALKRDTEACRSDQNFCPTRHRCNAGSAIQWDLTPPPLGPWMRRQHQQDL